jgi:branched-chain amino acid transport system ATP-binding protein
LENVTKDFGGLRAVDRVDMRVAPGERRAVIGPNGAGKTTLFNLITGELPLTDGQIVLYGENVGEMPPHQRIAFGLGRTYQITNIFPALTVEENVLLAAQGLSATKFDMLGRIPRDGELVDKVGQALEDTGLADMKNALASELSHGEQRQLEVALALALDPKLLMLDEPAAGLSGVERAMMSNLIQGLPRSLTLVLIEHDMDLALGLVDRVTCLYFGGVIADESPAEIRVNKQVRDCYLGVG